MLALLPSTEAVAGSFGAAAIILFALLIGHAVGDYALQSDFLALAKNRHYDGSRFFGVNKPPRGLWVNALAAHCLIHAGAVWLVTGTVVLAVIELCLHFIIDFAKNEGWTSFALDQSLHRLCKIAYAAALYAGLPWVTWSPM